MTRFVALTLLALCGGVASKIVVSEEAVVDKGGSHTFALSNPLDYLNVVNLKWVPINESVCSGAIHVTVKDGSRMKDLTVESADDMARFVVQWEQVGEHIEVVVHDFPCAANDVFAEAEVFRRNASLDAVIHVNKGFMDHYSFYVLEWAPLVAKVTMRPIFTCPEGMTYTGTLSMTNPVFQSENFTYTSAPAFNVTYAVAGMFHPDPSKGRAQNINDVYIRKIDGQCGIYAFDMDAYCLSVSD